MIRIEKYLPNLMTFGNLFCGLYGIIICLRGNIFPGGEVSTGGDLVTASFMIFLGALFDLFDGMAARLVKHSSALGKELDSLADVVTFGVLPACIMHILFLHNHENSWLFAYAYRGYPIISFLPFLIAAGAAYRLAKFNVSTTQSKTFIGLPSPSNGIFFASLPLILNNDPLVLGSFSMYLGDFITNGWVLIAMTLLLSWLMICNISMFSLKLKSFSWNDSRTVYIFGGIALILSLILQWAAIPLLLFIYIFLSIISKPKTDEIQS